MKPFIRNCSADSKVPELIDPTKPVEVYKNLNRNCWSVRQRGIVRFHTHAIVLKHCQLKVSESGRQRVLKQKRKNVHAFIKGIFITKGDNELQEGSKVTYNPYEMSTFTKDGKPCHTLDVAELSTVGVRELLEN